MAGAGKSTPTWRRRTSARRSPARCEVLTEIAGTRPVGWHTRSTPSPNTRRLLVEEGGFLYDSDDYSDDLPFYVEVSGKPHLVLPYSFDTNDMHYHQGFHRFVHGARLRRLHERRLRHAVDRGRAGTRR